MKEFLIITSEGTTYAPDESEVENCQILGRIEAENEMQARRKLMDDNPWIEECGYNMDETIVLRVFRYSTNPGVES